MTPSQSVAPTLELISPTLPGRLFELKKDLIRVGRDPSADVVLDRRDVSWLHAWIARAPDGFRIEDRDSRNGTAVDGIKLAPQAPVRLADGARIKICDHVLVFRLQAVVVEPARPGGLDAVLDDSDAGQATILGSIDDLAAVGVASAVGRPDEVLRAVLEINRNLGGTAELNEALGLTLATLFAIFREAEAGFILTREADGELIPRALRRRDPADRDPLTLSRTALDQVMTRGRGIVAADLAPDPAATAEGPNLPTDSQATGLSHHVGPPRTILCIPLLDRAARPIGIIQLVGRAGATGFRRDALDLLAAVAVPIAATVENHRLLRASADWAAAGAIQRTLLPRHRPRCPGFQFWEHYEPAQEVGGDYYDYIPLGGAEGPAATRWAVAVGDVVGKGMPAALLMSSLASEVRHALRDDLEPVDAVARLNRHFYDDAIDDRFITFLMVVVDAATRRIAVVNAGHPPPLVRRASGLVETLGEAESGPPLGVLFESAYRMVAAELDPGDVVVLYTDGISEAIGRHRRVFGLDGIRRHLAQGHGRPDEVGPALLQAVQRHAGNRPQADDIALVCFGPVASDS